MFSGPNSDFREGRKRLRERHARREGPQSAGFEHPRHYQADRMRWEDDEPIPVGSKKAGGCMSGLHHDTRREAQDDGLPDTWPGAAGASVQVYVGGSKSGELCRPGPFRPSECHQVLAEEKVVLCFDDRNGRLGFYE